MTKKLLALLLAAMMVVTCMAGCTRAREEWISVPDDEVVSGGDGETLSTDKNTTTGQNDKDGRTRKTTTKTNGSSTANVGGVTVGRTTRAPENALTFTPVEDAGANYAVKGNVSIAVDTVRPTDYDAMFDVMQALYPNINFTYDYWAHGSYDDAREYLSTRMKTGTAANIIWDEAGALPTYLTQGWVYPITDFVSKDPDAKYIPDNLKKDYTFCGELYALPHQATFETVTFNMDLLNRVNLSLPALEWTMDEYEAYLSKGADYFATGYCVGIEDLFDTYRRVCWYESSKAGGNFAAMGYNWDTRQITAQYLQTGAETFRKWRVMKTGVEAWYEGTQKNSSGMTNLKSKLGISNYGQAWEAGKALIEDQLNVTCDMYDELGFEWTMWTTPNVDGKMMMHVDHCFITATTPEADIDACYQALRFMTFSSNGNLARLTMYEDSQKGKYNLNSVVYFPTTTNPSVLNKFESLSCTNDVHMYYLNNIKNASRFDSFKLVPEFNHLNSEHLNTVLNEITDGYTRDLKEPVAKWNADMKTAWAQFETDLKKVQKEFNASH